MVKRQTERGTMCCHPSVQLLQNVTFFSTHFNLKCVSTEISGQVQMKEDKTIYLEADSERKYISLQL